jgi:hypothetical protein
MFAIFEAVDESAITSYRDQSARRHSETTL